MTCRFDRNRNALGVYRVLTDSILTSLVDDNLSLNNTYLLNNLMDYLGDFEYEPDDTITFIKEAVETVKNGLGKVLAKFESLDEFKTGHFANLNANKLGNHLATKLNTRYKSVLTKVVVPQPQEGDDREGVAENPVPPNALVKGRVQPSATMKNKVVDLFKGGNSNTPQNVSVNPNSVRLVTDVGSNYFKDADSVYRGLSRALTNKLYEIRILNPLTSNATNANANLNQDLKKYKNELFAQLTKGLKLSKGTPKVLYNESGDFINDNFDTVLKMVEATFNTLNDGQPITAGRLMAETISGNFNTDLLNRYNAMVTLKHFDTLVEHFSAGGIKVNSLYRNIESGKDKYQLTSTNKMRTNFSNEALNTALDETTKLYKMFIETIPVIKLNGQVSRDQFLTFQQVAFTINKLKLDISNTAPVDDLSNAIIGALSSIDNRGGRNLGNQDIKTLLSLYARIFRTPASDLKLKKNTTMAKLLKAIDSSTGMHPELAINNTIATKFERFHPSGSNINFLQMLVHNMTKVDTNTYGEITYDYANSSFKQTTMQSKVSDQQRSVFRNGIGATALFKQTSSNPNYIADNYGIIVGDGSGKALKELGISNYNSGSDQGKVFFNFSRDFKISYDIATGAFVKHTATGAIRIDDFDTFLNSRSDADSGIIIPNTNMESSEILQRINEDGELSVPVEYSNYQNLVAAFENLLHQPLSSDNYKFLDTMRDEIDGNHSPGKHVKVMLALLGNFAFISAVNVNGINGDILQSPATKKQKVESALKKLGSPAINPDNIWNARLGRYQIDFNFTNKGINQDYLSDYVDALNSYYKSNIKAVTLNTEGNFVPTYSISSQIHRYIDVINDIKFSPFAQTSPLSNNFILKSSANIRPLISAFEARSGIRNHNGEIVSPSRMNSLELLKANILYEFLGNKLNDGSFKIQPTNYADKNKHTLINIDPKATVQFYNSANRSWESKQYGELTIDQIIDTYYATMEDYYTKLSKELIRDYSKLFDSDKALLSAYYETTNLAKYFQEAGLELNLNENPRALVEQLKNAPSSDGTTTLYQEVILDSTGQLIASDIATELDIAEAIYNATVASNLGEFSSDRLIAELEKVDKIFSLVHGNTLTKAFRKQGVKWVKNLHFEKNGSSFGINKSLIPTILSFTKDRAANIKSHEKYFLETLEAERFTIDYVNEELRKNKTLSEGEIKQIYTNLRKFEDEGVGRYKLYIGDLNGNFEINPILKDYYWNHNLIARNFQHLTVGSPLGHPGNGSTHEEVMAGRLVAQNKRMVIHQATKHPYLMNMINGIGFKSQKIYMADPEAIVFGLLGRTEKLDSVDGATFSTPLNTILLNNSLNDQRVGVTHKSISGGIDPRTGAAFLTKHALFTMTNENIRNSPTMRNLIVKTMRNRFSRIAGVELNLDLSKDYNGNHINITDLIGDVAFIKTEHHDHINDFEIGDLIFVSDLVKNEDGSYKVTYTNKDRSNVVESNLHIDDYYSLWNALGGDSSVTYNSGLDKYVPSNVSWDALAEYTNRVGFWNNAQEIESKVLVDKSDKTGVRKLRNALKLFQHTPNGADKNTSKTSSLTQKNVIQPLKLNHIGEITFFSGQKVGMENGVTLDEVMNHTGDISQVATLTSNLGNGIQLNADHEVDQSEVTEQTQVLNTLSFTGATPEYANKAFGGIAKYISTKLGDLIRDVEVYDEAAKARTYDFIKKLVVKTFQDGEVDGIANTITHAIKEEFDTGVITNLQIPISSPDLYTHVNTAVANYFTKEGIRRKMPGLPAVAKPYSPFIRFRKLPNGSTVSEVAFQKWRSQNLDEPELIPIYNHEFDVGDTLIDPDGKRIEIVDASTYVRTKIRMNLNPEGWQKDRFAERELASTYHKLNINGVGSITYFDIPIFAIDNLLQDVRYSYENYISKLGDKRVLSKRQEIEEGGTIQDRISGALAKLHSRISEYNTVLELAKTQHPELAHIAPLLLNDNSLNYSDFSGVTKNKIKNLASATLSRAHKEKRIPLPFTITKSTLPIEIIAEDNSIAIDSIETVSGEIASGFPHVSAFDIDHGMDVSDVTEEYFKEKLNNRSIPTTNQYDFYMKQSNGDHLYVLIEGSQHHSNLMNDQVLEPVSLEVVERDGKLYEVDQLGDIKYETGTSTVYRGMVDGNVIDYVIVSDIEDLKRLSPMFKGRGSKYDMLIPNFAIAKGGNLDYLGLFLDAMSEGLVKNRINELAALQQLLVRKSNNSADYINIRNILYSTPYNTPEKVQAQLIKAYKKLESAKNADQMRRAQYVIDKLEQYQSDPKTYAENLIEVYATNLDSYVDRLSRDIESKNLSIEDYVEAALFAFEQENIKDIVELNERKAKAKYASFKEALKVTTARIPGQDFQSYAAMKIVHFFNDEENTIMVPPRFQWTTGGDFDIDKVFTTFYSLDRSGLISGWTSLWNTSTEEYLEASLKMPLPQPTNYEEVTLGNPNGLSRVEYQAIVDFVNAGNKYANVEHFSTLADATFKIANDGLSVTEPILDEEISNALIQYANWYMNESDKDLKDPKGAALNAIFTGVRGSISDIRNIINAYEPVTFGEYRVMADGSLKGQQMKRMSFNNPVDIFRAQVANMVGKDVIGIAASTGLKSYSAIAGAFSKVRDLGSSPGVPLMRKYTVPKLVDGKFKLVSGSGIYGVEFTEENFANLAEYLTNVLTLAPQEVEEIRLGLLERGSVSLDLSAILSSATDNAKELILSRINAGPDTASYYLAGSMLGVDTQTMYQLMTSDVVEDILRLNTRDVFKGTSPKFKASLQQIKDGALDSRPYFNFKFATNAIVKLEEQVEELKDKLIDLWVDENVKGEDKRNVDREGTYIDRIRKNPFYYMSLLGKVVNKDPDLKPKILTALAKVKIKDQEGFTTAPIRNKRRNAEMEMYDDGGMGVSMYEDQGDIGFDQGDMGFDQGGDDMGDMDIYGDNGDGDINSAMYGQGKAEYEHPLNIAMARYLEDFSTFIKPEHQTVEAKAILGALESLGRFKDDIETLARLMSVNQQVKNNHYDLKNFVNTFRDYVQKNYMPIYGDKLRPLKDEEIDSYIASVFNDEYVSGEAYKSNSLGTSVIDLLGVISLNPHLKAMLHTAYTTYTLNKNMSVKTRAIDSILDEIRKFNWVSPEIYKKVTRFIDDAIITTALSSLPSNKTSFVAHKGEIVQAGQKALEQNLIMDLTNATGRMHFVNWFENTVLEDLRRGVLKDEDGLPIYGDPMVSGNEFVKRLTLDMRIDPATGQNYTYFHIPVNLISEDNADLMVKLKMSLASMRNSYYANTPVTDLFYLYNLIVHKGAISSYSFTTLLDGVTNLDTDNLISNYIGLLGNMDYSETFNLDNIYTNNIDQLAARGVGKNYFAVPQLGDDVSRNAKIITVRNWDDTSKLTYFEHFVLTEDKGRYVYRKIEPQMNNKYVNLEVRDTNSNRIGDVKRLARAGRLNKLIANAVRRNINC